MAVHYINIPNASGQGDFKTFARYTSFIQDTCNYDCKSFNDICADKNARIFIAEGDLIYLNLAFPDTVNPDPIVPEYGWIEGGDYLIKVDIVEPDGNEVEVNDVSTIASAWQVGSKDEKPFQRIALEASSILELIDSDCFILKVTVQTSLNDPDPIVCYYGMYKSVPTETDEVEQEGNCPTDYILIEGVFSGFDCDGNWYGRFSDGNFAGTSNYESRVGIRLKGTIEIVSYEKEVVETDAGISISTSIRELALVRFYPLNLTEIQKLVKILSADIFLVNGDEWQTKSGLAKDNEEDSQWHSSIQLSRPYCDRTNIECD